MKMETIRLKDDPAWQKVKAALVEYRATITRHEETIRHLEIENVQLRRDLEYWRGRGMG